MAKFVIRGSNAGFEQQCIGRHRGWTHELYVFEAKCFWDAFVQLSFHPEDGIIFMPESPLNSPTKREYRCTWNHCHFLVEKVGE